MAMKKMQKILQEAETAQDDNFDATRFFIERVS